MSSKQKENTHEGVEIRAIGRRAPMKADAPRGRPARMRPGVLRTRARWITLAWPVVRWFWAIVKWELGVVFDVVFRRYKRRAARARRVRRLFEGLGGSAVRLGLYISQRLDLIPPEFALELRKMRDERPPVEMDYMLERTAAASELPLEEAYGVIDPEPIVTNSISSSFQALLQDGQRVVIRVRRPDAIRRFDADLFAISLLMKTAEWSGIVRPDTFKQLRLEMRQMVDGDLDFRAMARSHRIFRRRVKRDRLRWATASGVYDNLSSDDVLVSEFASGVRCSEVIAAVSSQDSALLAQLRKMDIEPEIVGRRLLHLAWWSLFEGLIFNAQPSPEELAIRPGNQLSFFDMGHCGHSPKINQRLALKLLVRISKDDVSGAAEIAIQLLSPLPFIDAFDFKKSIEARMWPRVFAMRDRKAPPLERTSVGLWLAILEEVAERRMQIRNEVVRLFQALIFHETMVAQIMPDLNLFKELRRYRKQAARRASRRVRRDGERILNEGIARQTMAQMETASGQLTRLAFWLDVATRNVPLNFVSMSRKASYVASVVLKSTTWALTLAAVFILGQNFYTHLTGEAFQLSTAIRATLSSPVYLVILGALLFVSARRILFRLDDMDHD